MVSKAPDDFSFKKEEKLTGKKSIEELFKKGSSFNFPPLLLKSLQVPELEKHQVLIAVPKKYQKRAVDRNLIKRRIREAYRLNKYRITESVTPSHIVILYLSKDLLTFAEIQHKLITLMERLQKKSKPKTS